MNVKADVRTLTSAEFEKDAARAQRAADGGPVFIVTGDEISHVLVTKAEFDRLMKQAEEEVSLRDALMHPQGDDFDFEPPRMKGGPFKPPAFD